MRPIHGLQVAGSPAARCAVAILVPMSLTIALRLITLWRLVQPRTRESFGFEADSIGRWFGWLPLTALTIYALAMAAGVAWSRSWFS